MNAKNAAQAVALAYRQGLLVVDGVPYGANRDITIDAPPGFNAARMLRESKPEWVMLGLNWPGPGVILLASKELTQAELDFRARQYNYTDWSQFLTNFMNDIETTLFIHLKGFTIVAGPNYAECLASLLRQWNPDERLAIGASRDD
jgi:hypothetical protein